MCSVMRKQLRDISLWKEWCALKRARFGLKSLLKDLLGLLGLLGQEHGLDVGEDTSLGDGDS